MKMAVLTFLLMLLLGCSSAQVRLESEPSGAEILLNDKSIGATPLDLSAANYKEEFKAPLLDLKIAVKGHEPQRVLIPTKGVQNYHVILKPYSGDYFEKTMLTDFQNQGNLLVREILQIQGLLVAKKNQEAEERLVQFLQKYPNLAAGYVLQANLDLAKNNKDHAIQSLERGISLDSTDAVLVRMLERLKKGDRL